ncbi:MAG: tellurium resistance protein TerC [Bacteroidia bacterium]|nr:MAG: tellurium resistance protein TerC [Bacteroidia bacterium]
METLSIENFITLAMLILLQLVLGFDNLLYISLESKKAPQEKQAFVRRLGIGLAIFLRIGLLFLLVSVISYFQDTLFKIELTGLFIGKFNIHSLIVLFGGGFIIYTATKEIWHMISLEEKSTHENTKKASVANIVVMIVVMNLVFSFDSILSAIALTNVFWVMAVAIIVGGILMMWLSDKVANFLKKNRMYEVLGLFILFLVGVMLLSEGGHLAHLELFDKEITPMNKATFYFILVIMLLVDIIQGKYQKNLMKLKEKTKQETSEK